MIISRNVKEIERKGTGNVQTELLKTKQKTEMMS